MTPIPLPNSDHPLIRKADRIETIWYQFIQKVTARVNLKPRLLATLTTTSGTTQTASSLPECPFLLIEVNGVSFTAAVFLTLALSDDNGASFGTANQISGALGAAANTISGVATVWNTGEIGLTKLVQVAQTTGGPGNQTYYAIEATKTGVITALRFAGGTFDAGSIKIYGIS